MLVAYVSSHGFGHLTRTCEVLRAVRARAPSLPIAIATAAPEAVVRRAGPAPLEVRPLATDVGVAQRDALTMDLAETAGRWRAFEARFDALAAAEAAWLRARGARAVLADIPPLGFAAAARAGVPALGLGNFSWDWIYAHLARHEPALAGAAAHAARAYAGADLLLELPFAGDLAAFARRERIGFVARRPRLPREEVRRRLGLDGARDPVALVSFGGYGVPGVDRAALEAGGGVRWLTSADLPEQRLAALGVDYPDLVAAADAVVTKPGYGIVTDALGAHTPLVYTERGDFPEYPIMVAEMGHHLPAVHVSNDDLRAGRAAEAVRRAVALPWPPAPDLAGADRAAARILERVG